MKTETQKRVISRNDFEINSAKNTANNLVKHLQNVIDKAQTVDVKLTADKLMNACYNSKDWITAQITDPIETPTIGGGLKMNRQKFIETLELPDVTEFLEVMEYFNRHSQSNGGRFASLVTIENGKACIDNEAMDLVIEKATVYATGEAEISLYDAMEAAATALNAINERLTEGIKMDDIRSLFLFEKATERFIPNPEKFKQLLTNN